MDTSECTELKSKTYLLGLPWYTVSFLRTAVERRGAFEDFISGGISRLMPTIAVFFFSNLSASFTDVIHETSYKHNNAQINICMDFYAVGLF